MRVSVVFVDIDPCARDEDAAVEIEVPEGNRLQSAAAFFGSPVSYTTRKDGKKTFAVINVPEGPAVDNILKLTFRKEL